MEVWRDTCVPSLDEDSPLPWHHGPYSIPPFQTHSRYFYGPLGEGCCGRHFVELFYQQFHPYPQCPDCARLTLVAASHICWQCRTYFRRYGTGMMQQIVGITPQRYDLLRVTMPDQGLNQLRLPAETSAQLWRDEAIQRLRQPILRVLLPQEVTCQFWINVCIRLRPFPNRPILADLPVVPMPYYNEEALLPLPQTPAEGFRQGLSWYAEVLTDNIDVEGEDEVPPPAHE